MNSCYIHIPFCKSICSYCDFCKNYYNEKIVNNYLDRLDDEIKKSYKNEKLKTLYIGGGTPSSLSKTNLDKLFNILKNINLKDNYEYTFECNYEDITEDLLLVLKNNGVNRLSIGLQTFNIKYQEILNRKINKSDMIEKINLSKKYFDNINVDLMYALPNQTIEELKADIIEFIKLDVTHISTYCLIIEDNTILKITKTRELDDDIQSDMYYMIVKLLKDNGYNHYEISNFSKKGYESKHNLNYWNNDNYYGFGSGASGFINNVRYDNTRSITKYISVNIRINEEYLTKEDLIKDEVMLNLRKTDGINLNKFYTKYDVSFEKAFNYKKLIDENLLKQSDNNIYISEEKLFISNEIIIKLLDNYILE